MILNTRIKNIKLINARKEEGLTQLEVAEKAKVEIRAYQNYEAGGRLPNVRIARRIAEALNRLIDDLF